MSKITNVVKAIPAGLLKGVGHSSRAAALIVAGLMVLSNQAAAASSRESFLRARMVISAPSAAQDLCYRYSWACSRSTMRSALNQADFDLISQVNRKINRQIRPVSDASQYRTADYWRLPERGRGDCEDIALLKKKLLIKAGIAPERLLLATVLDRKRKGHAVLVLRTDAGDYVLDNLTDKIKPWRSTGYTFLRMQNPDQPEKWIGLLVRG